MNFISHNYDESVTRINLDRVKAYHKVYSTKTPGIRFWWENGHTMTWDYETEAQRDMDYSRIDGVTGVA